MKSSNGFALSLMFMLILADMGNYTAAITESHGEVSASVAAKSEEMVPLMEEKLLMVNETRRKLGSFQICALCTCCGGAKGLCLASPCCYAINCNIPNRPFGFCSFTPKTCNCFGCHL